MTSKCKTSVEFYAKS